MHSLRVRYPPFMLTCGSIHISAVVQLTLSYMFPWNGRFAADGRRLPSVGAPRSSCSGSALFFSDHSDTDAKSFWASTTFQCRSLRYVVARNSDPASLVVYICRIS